MKGALHFSFFWRALAGPLGLTACGGIAVPPEVRDVTQQTGTQELRLDVPSTMKWRSGQLERLVSPDITIEAASYWVRAFKNYNVLVEDKGGQRWRWDCSYIVGMSGAYRFPDSLRCLSNGAFFWGGECSATVSDRAAQPSTRYKVETQELKDRSRARFALVVLDPSGFRLAAGVRYPDHWRFFLPKSHPERDLLMGTLALQAEMSMASGGCPRPKRS